jgi:hypothetical protein
MKTVLRTAAVLLWVVAVIELVLFDDFQPPPFVIGGLLWGLSLVAGKAQRLALYVVVALSVVVPVGAVVRYLRNEVMVGVPIFDLMLFGWLLTNAVRALRSGGAGRG